ncbi:hypothetical protein SAMN05216352_10298 [Alteribacillus bidgolensis]|uniref:Uncharacterized protein n=1 Tax=Alteribacillus bidgolensis TaxID=930129 RepID=A0A1G8E781_9BACI|nr:hypothetical protein SAMN05216352_10298 [Alteribacillus bidgolensis]
MNNGAVILPAPILAYNDKLLRCALEIEQG